MDCGAEEPNTLETISALSFEQLGLWDKAQQLYETAQIKARSGALPYGESGVRSLGRSLDSLFREITTLGYSYRSRKT